MSVLPAFGLHRPESIAEALEVLTFDDLPVAGGTELLLAMRMRVLRPDTLVDIKRIPELQTIEKRDGHIVIGGTVTHAAASASPVIREHFPILPRVLSQVGNPRIRASGTLAGNLVFAEPKSDVTTILMGLDAEIVLASNTGMRGLSVDEFILGAYYAAREPGELLTAIKIPVGRVVAAAYLKYQTMERPTVGVAALDLNLEGRHVRRIVVGAVADRPHMVDVETPAPVNASAIAAEIEPIADIAGTARYKRHVTEVYINRAVARLDEEAGT